MSTIHEPVTVLDCQVGARRDASGVVPLSPDDFELREETDERVPAGLLPSKLGDQYLRKHSFRRPKYYYDLVWLMDKETTT